MGRTTQVKVCVTVFCPRAFNGSDNSDATEDSGESDASGASDAFDASDATA